MGKGVEIRSILDFPYEDRRFICVYDDKELSEEASRSRFNLSRFIKVTGATSTASAGGVAIAFPWLLTAGSVAGVTIPAIFPLLIPVFVGLGVTVGGGNELLKVFRKRKGALILRASRSAVADIKFPIGHPQRNTVYVGHPGVADRYFTLSDFHSSLFAEKYAEAVRLLRSLGATDVEISYGSGWKKDWAAQANIEVPVVSSAKVSANGSFKEDIEIIGKWNFGVSKVKPRIPEQLVWYRDEPTWQEVANGRVEGRLASFAMDLTYKQDFGVNAALKAAAQKAKLEIGGQFTEFQSTVWKIKGNFPQ